DQRLKFRLVLRSIGHDRFRPILNVRLVLILNLESLRPDVWIAAHPEHFLTYRRDEAEAAAIARRPPNPFEPEPSAARTFRGWSAPGRLRQRSSDDPGTGSCTHRCAMGKLSGVRTLAPPVAAGLPTGCGCAVTACRRLDLGTALDIMSPGKGARDPGMV